MQITNLKKIVGGLALAGALALTGVIGFAQQGVKQGPGGDAAGHGDHQWKHDGDRNMRGGGGGREGFGGGPFGRLNLTDAQKEQMRQIAIRYREANKGAHERGDEGGRGEGFDLFNGGTFNEAAVRAAAQARANARVEMEVTHARMMSEMYNVLTTEQKAQLNAERQQWEQKRQEHRSQREAQPGQQKQ